MPYKRLYNVTFFTPWLGEPWTVASSQGVGVLIPYRSIHTMSALPTGDSGYQLDDGEGRVLKMHPK